MDPETDRGVFSTVDHGQVGWMLVFGKIAAFRLIYFV